MTDQGQLQHPQQAAQPLGAQLQSTLGNNRAHRRTASSNYYGAPFQTIPEDRESRALSSLYAASSQAPSSFAAHDRDSRQPEDLESDNDYHSMTSDNQQSASVATTYNSGRGLVREASVGRKHRPTLTQIGNSGSWSRRGSRQSTSPPREASPNLPAGIAPPSGPTFPPPPIPSLAVSAAHLRAPSTESVFASGTGFVSPSASTFSDSISKIDTESPVRHLRPSPAQRPSFNEQAELRQSSRPFTADSGNSSGSFRFARGGADDSNPNFFKSKLSERVGSKKPEPLKLDLVKDAETRGSLTSLPDLIKRALRLASNLEVGKTASRFGTDWMFESDGEKGSNNGGRRRNSMGEMINSFPSTPQLDSPRRRAPYSIMPRSAGLHSALSRSFTPNPDDGLDGAHEKQKPTRRCCGMPLWIFLLILLLVLALILAAVLIPIFLIVVPNSHHDPNCVSSNIGGTSNAQVGSAIPSLLQSANSSFGLPLDGAILLSAFAAAKLSCSAENELVTFSSLTRRSISQQFNLVHPHQPQFHVARSLGTTDLAAQPTPTPAVLNIAIADAHAVYNPIAPRQHSAATSNGIIFAMSTTSSATPTATASPSATSASASPTSTSSGTTAFNPTALNLSFARTAVLYILQQTQSLDAAQAAQSALAAFFANPASMGGEQGAKSVDVGGGWSVDLVGGRVVDGSGVGVGGFTSSG